MKRILTVLSLGLILMGPMASNAHAGFETFDAFNHPNFDSHAAGPFGFILNYRNDAGTLIRHGFSFVDMKITFDTTSGSTGKAILQGTATDNRSGGSDVWNIEAVFNNIRHQPGGTFNPTDVPYDQMFDDLISAGFGSGGRLMWDMEMATLSTSDPDTLYKGARVLGGKANANGNESELWYRKALSPTNFPGPEYDLLGMSGWVMADAVTDFNGRETPETWGDFHFVLKETSNPVPEPGTMALMGIGLSGMGFIRKRKTA